MSVAAREQQKTFHAALAMVLAAGTAQAREEHKTPQ